MKQIQEVRQGRSTDTFKVATNAASYAEEKCFSVVYLEGGKHRSLDLVALSRSDAEAWVAGLGTLVREMGEHFITLHWQPRNVSCAAVLYT